MACTTEICFDKIVSDASIFVCDWFRWDFGKGFGNSVQKKPGFIPEAHTDMIFSIICEELGLVGALVIIGLLIYLLYLIYQVAKILKMSTVLYWRWESFSTLEFRVLLTLQ